MAERRDDDVPRDPWGNPLPPEDRPPARPRPEDFPPPFPNEDPSRRAAPPSPPSWPQPSSPPAPPSPQQPSPPSEGNPAWPGRPSTPRSDAPPAPPAPSAPSGPPPPTGGPAWPGTPPPPAPPGPQGPPPGGPWGAPSQGWNQGPVWAPPKRDGLAVGGLVCGILGLICGVAGLLGIVIGPTAIVLGVLSRRRITQSNGALTGEGFTTAAIILGTLGTAIAIFWGIVLIANPDVLTDFLDQVTSTTTTTPSG